MFIETTCTSKSPLKKMKSPFKKPNYASPLSKFPALAARLGLDDDGEDSTSSIVDVDNDQVKFPTGITSLNDYNY
jgi:hypothetical protein